jgi:hypothetical protein
MNRNQPARTLPKIATWAVLLLLAGTVAAQVPESINFQGRLSDNSPQQNLITGDVAMEFRIFDGQTAGSQLWSESWSVVGVHDGLFSVMLGTNGSPLPASVFASGAERWLEIVVAGEVLDPRQRLGSVAFAHKSSLALDSGSLGGVPASGWQTGISESCNAGYYLRAVNADGTVVCEPDADSGGDVTGVSVGYGMTGGGIIGDVTVGLDFSIVGTATHTHPEFDDPFWEYLQTQPQQGQLVRVAPFERPVVLGWIREPVLITESSLNHEYPTGSDIHHWYSPASLVLPITFTFEMIFNDSVPMLTWMQEVITDESEDHREHTVIDLLDPIFQDLHQFTLENAWPSSWELLYLPDNVVGVRVTLTANDVTVTH